MYACYILHSKAKEGAEKRKKGGLLCSVSGLLEMRGK